MAKRRKSADHLDRPIHRPNERSKPLAVKIEIVAVGGKEGEALLRMQRAAIVGALTWAAAADAKPDQPGAASA